METRSQESSKEIYEGYVSKYGVIFRANKDYQFEEKPRQVITTALLVICLVIISYFTSSAYYNKDNSSSEHASIFKEEEIDLNNPILVSIRYGLLGLLITMIFYCFLHSRDSLFVRPHPGVWRIVHAFGLLQLVILIFIYVVPPDHGRRILYLLFPGSSDPKSVFSGTIELDCSINTSTIIRQLKTPWFTCHVIGWFLKMCMFRDWTFCIVFSLAFEAAEISFHWLIPEMKECWWDSIFLDTLVSNMIGMIAGAWYLTYLGSKRFDWVKPTFGSRGSNKRNNYKVSAIRSKLSYVSFIPKNFFPFTFSDYNWRFFESSYRLAHSLFILIVAITLELNSFFLMYVLDLKATHGLNIARTINVCLVALLTIPEHYEYIEGKTHRIGHNELLLGSIYIVEVLTIFKYGPSRFSQFIPPWEIISPWLISLGLLFLWSYFHFHDLADLRSSIGSEKKSDSTNLKDKPTSLFHRFGRRLLHFPVILSFAPLLSLARFYHY